MIHVPNWSSRLVCSNQGTASRQKLAVLVQWLPNEATPSAFTIRRFDAAQTFEIHRAAVKYEDMHHDSLYPTGSLYPALFLPIHEALLPIHDKTLHYTRYIPD